MSTNRFILSQVCIPDFLLPFPPNTLSIFKEESLCPNGLISVYMLYDKNIKKTILTALNYRYAIKRTKELNEKNDAEIESNFTISRNFSNLTSPEEINYLNLEDFENFQIHQFEAELTKVDKFDSEFDDNIFLKTLQQSIVSEVLEIRKKIIADFNFADLVNITNDIKPPKNTLDSKTKTIK